MMIEAEICSSEDGKYKRYIEYVVTEYSMTQLLRPGNTEVKCISASSLSS
jgi:hypothetical protein